MRLLLLLLVLLRLLSSLLRASCSSVRVVMTDGIDSLQPIDCTDTNGDWRRNVPLFCFAILTD